MSWADDLRGIRLSLHRDAREDVEGAGYRAGVEPDESMNSRVSWSAEGIDPSVRERAEAAARRAGMSLSEWLDSTIGGSSPPDFRGAAEAGQTPASYQQHRDVTDIHQRLDSITRQIEQIARPIQRTELPRNEFGVARQLNDAISRLDARLSQISNPAPAREAQYEQQQRRTEMVERAASQVYRPSPPLNPGSLDFAIAEIAARQSELEAASRPTPPRSAPPAPPASAPSAPAGPDFSVLERQLLKITSQIEALQRPDGIEESIAAFRSELSLIRQAITEAMPRRAIESIEDEIRSLSRRIDENRHSGIDNEALGGIERALGEIREVLRSLTPAEKLAGYDDAIRNLGAKLDLILRANDDPSTVRQLEAAIAALRNIVSNIASNDALVRLSDDVRTLSSKVDQLDRAGDHSDSFAVLEARIAALTSTLEVRERPEASVKNEQLEGSLRALSERLDRMPVGNDSASEFAHLEQRVSYLLERIENSDQRSGDLGRVEQGLHDILRHLETQHAIFEALGDNRRPAETGDNGLVDVVKRELSDIRFSQSETDRNTQNSLETVHNTLGHVVDRLAMIEGDLRIVRAPLAPESAAPSARPSPAPSLALQPIPAQPMPPQPMGPAASAPTPMARVVISPEPKPELPNPAAAQGAFAAAAREFHAAAASISAAADEAPGVIAEILEPHTASSRSAIEPELPPDHPLEPGTRPTARVASPSERIAASESAISQVPPAPTSEKARASSFIAAARRAAQAAQAAQPTEKAKWGQSNKPAAEKAREPSTITSKVRSVLVAASVVVIVLGTFKLAMTLLDGGPAPQLPPTESSSEASPSSRSTGNELARPEAPASATPSMTPPIPIGRQSLNSAGPVSSESMVSVAIPQASPSSAPAAASTGDVTNAIPAPLTASASRKLAIVSVPPTETLPEAIGGPVIRAAAMKGDPTAAYEIGLRFAEGRGVAPNFGEAAKWYDRAAQAGVVPAMFRLGTLYEKGLGLQKDVDIARRYYLQAAERGSAKAMHNLAVLDADGGGQGSNYKSAAQWFQKAADRGVADSQFNLGILYARGIGVEQNLAESFKWFSLAAAQGDADAARKRDDLAKRLDAQSLAAAKLAIQTFTAEPQPEDAVNVAAPAGGWDSVPAAPAPKAVLRPASSKRASAAH